MNSGQTLVSLIFFMVIVLTIASGAVVMTLVNAQVTSKFQEGNNAYAIAESGAENALLRLLRDPSYTGETIIIGSGISIATVSGTQAQKTIKVKGIDNKSARLVQVDVVFTNLVASVSAWKEVYQ